MKELTLIIAESDSSSLVLTSASDSEEFYLPVTQELRDLVTKATLGVETTHEHTDSTTHPLSERDKLSSTSDTQAHSKNTETGIASPFSGTSGSVVNSTDLHESTQLSNSRSRSELNASSDNDASDSDSSTTHAESDSNTTTNGTTSETSSASQTAGSLPSSHASENKASEPKLRAVDTQPSHSSSRPRRTHLSIRPRTIQERIRQGATIAELAEEADTDESTIEPYAWPILQERALIAENAHSAHPIVEAEGGPSKQTLWEVLATALAARGESLNDCEWDAYQAPSKRWIVTVSWNKATAGQTASHVAEFYYDRHQGEPQVIEPSNSLAADLVDPRYGRPVRSISAVHPLSPSRPDHVDFAAELDEDEATYQHDHQPQDTPHGTRGEEDPQGDNEITQKLRPIRNSDKQDTMNILQNPPSGQAKTRRRRKAVTPHWEDVLLGVRTNPKKK